MALVKTLPQRNENLELLSLENHSIEKEEVPFFKDVFRGVCVSMAFVFLYLGAIAGVPILVACLAVALRYFFSVD